MGTSKQSAGYCKLASVSAFASASGRCTGRGTVTVGSASNAVAPAPWLAVDRAEGQVTAVESCKAVGFFLGRTEDRPGCEFSSNYGLEVPAGECHSVRFRFRFKFSVG